MQIILQKKLIKNGNKKNTRNEKKERIENE